MFFSHKSFFLSIFRSSLLCCLLSFLLFTFLPAFLTFYLPSLLAFALLFFVLSFPPCSSPLIFLYALQHMKLKTLIKAKMECVVSNSSFISYCLSFSPSSSPPILRRNQSEVDFPCTCTCFVLQFQNDII